MTYVDGNLITQSVIPQATLINWALNSSIWATVYTNLSNNTVYVIIMTHNLFA